MKILHPEKVPVRQIKNIVFDWGGVLVNLDYEGTISAFDKIGLPNFKEYFNHTHQGKLFKQLEIGAISNDAFRTALKKDINNSVTDEQIDNAWMAILLDIPKSRIEILRKLRQKYRIFLLSNTNSIHVTNFNASFEKRTGINFPGLFEKAYYSHEVGLRKPGAEIFHHMIQKSKLVPEETLFIDDTEVNIDTASELGLISFYLLAPHSTETLFEKWPGLK